MLLGVEVVGGGSAFAVPCHVGTAYGGGMERELIPIPPVNHILHLLLSVLTCGLWLPVWAALSWQRSRQVARAWRGEPEPPGRDLPPPMVRR